MAAPAHAAEVGLVRFARALRAAGVPVGSGQITQFAEAVAILGPTDLGDVYWAGRAALVSRAAHLPVYDLVFARAFGLADDQPGRAAPIAGTGIEIVLDRLVDAGEGGKPQDPADQPVTIGAVAADTEALRAKRFADLTAEEHAAVRRLISALRLDAPARRSRRLRRARRGPRPDLRRSLRRALRTDAELIVQLGRARRIRPRRLILLLDVSGSMSQYSRALLSFAHAVARGGAEVEVFCFGTRITRVTRALRSRDPDLALAAAAAEVADWDGGTRIGAGIAEFRRRWGWQGMARGAVIAICSDGLEQGDPGLLAAEMARLSRLAHRIVWVNPLKGDPRYRPLARGMAAALPSIDIFLPGHNLASLESLAEIFSELR